MYTMTNFLQYWMHDIAYNRTVLFLEPKKKMSHSREEWPTQKNTEKLAYVDGVIFEMHT